MEEEKKEKTGAQKALYLFAYSKGALQLFLAFTTFAGGYFLAVNMVADWLPFLPEWIIGGTAGLLIMWGIDGQLDASFAGLQDEENAKKAAFFLILAILTSIGTGGFTAFAGWAVGQIKATPTGMDKKEEYISQRNEEAEAHISRLQASIKQDSIELSEIQAKWQQDTARAIAAGNDSHVRLYRSGGYRAKRYQTDNYQTMQAFCANIDTINAGYAIMANHVRGLMALKEKAISTALSKDATANAQAELAGIDAANVANGDTIKFGIWYADIISLLFVWIGFFAQRKLKSAGAKFNIRTKSIWVAAKDWADNMTNSIGESSDAFTASIQDLLAGIIHLISWVVGLFTTIITAPTKIELANVWAFLAGLAKGLNRTTAKAAEVVNKAAEKIPDSTPDGGRTVVTFMGNSTPVSPPQQPNISAVVSTLDSTHNSTPVSPPPIAGIQRAEKIERKPVSPPVFQRPVNRVESNNGGSFEGEAVRLNWGEDGRLKKVKIGQRWYTKSQLGQQKRNALNYALKTDNPDTAEKNKKRAEFFSGLLARFDEVSELKAPVK